MIYVNIYMCITFKINLCSLYPKITLSPQLNFQVLFSALQVGPRQLKPFKDDFSFFKSFG